MKEVEIKELNDENLDTWDILRKTQHKFLKTFFLPQKMIQSSVTEHRRTLSLFLSVHYLRCTSNTENEA